MGIRVPASSRSSALKGVIMKLMCSFGMSITSKVKL